MNIKGRVSFQSVRARKVPRWDMDLGKASGSTSCNTHKNIFSSEEILGTFEHLLFALLSFSTAFYLVLMTELKNNLFSSVGK